MLKWTSGGVRLTRLLRLSCVASLGIALAVLAACVPRGAAVLDVLPAPGFSSVADSSLAPVRISTPVAGVAEHRPAPDVGARVSPSLPDGWYGWRVTPTYVDLAASVPGSEIRYAWDSRFGPWRRYSGTLVVPEGKHVLYALATDSRGRSGELFDMPVKVDYSSPRRLGFADREPLVDGRLAAWDSVDVRARVRPWAGPKVVRLGGVDRYATAIEVSKTDFRSAATVVIARGDLFPDALSAAGLAGTVKGPIELVRPTQLPPSVAEEIRRLGATEAIIVGGTGAVSAGVEASLRGLGLTITRCGGIDRYDTSARVAQEVQARGGDMSRTFIARGDTYPDCLAISPAAYQSPGPILLVRPTAVPPTVLATIARLRPGRVIVAGGSGAVSDGVVGRLRSAAGGESVRLGGADRYETAALIADYAVGGGLGSWELVGIATGHNFPDGLCGGAGVGQSKGVIMLTRFETLPASVRQRLQNAGPVLRQVQVFGGTGAVSPAVWNEIVAAIR